MLDIFIATIAGFVSFISPCVLPLVPAYIGYMSGRVTHTVAAQVDSAQISGASGGAAASLSPGLVTRFSTGLHSLAFVGGFTFVFVTLGILGTAFVRQVGSTHTVEGMIGRIGGIFIIFFGLHFMGVIPKFFAWLRKNPALISTIGTSIVVAAVGSALILWGFAGTLAVWDTSNPFVEGWTISLGMAFVAAFLLALLLGGAFSQPAAFWNKTLNSIDQAFYADTRRQMTARGDQGFSGSAIMGVIFAAGWTPCIGPTLGLAMTMAANSADIPRAAMLMTAYSLGMGIPFVLTALMLDSAQGGLRRITRHMNTIKLVSGGFLVFIGFIIASGQLQSLSQRFSIEFGDFSYRVEQCTVGAVEGHISWGQYWPCVTDAEDYRTLREQHSAAAEAEEASSDGVEDARSNGVAESAVSELSVGLAVGDLAPDFETETVGGEMMSLADVRGDVVLLNFWFTTCPPCRFEMPEFQQAYADYADQGLHILAVNREETAETITSFADELGLTFPLLKDLDGRIQRLYSISSYPSTFIIDRDGVIVYRSFGVLSAQEIHDLVQDALS